MSDSDENQAAIASEVSAALDHELASLNNTTLSQLRRVRYKAIDHGAIIDRPDSFVRWSAVASLVGGVLILLLGGHMVMKSGEGEFVDQGKIDQFDTREDLEIYEWLYNHYG